MKQVPQSLGHLAWTPGTTFSSSESFFFLKLSSPAHWSLSLIWHRFLLSIEISAPVTRDTMFCNGFQEVSSPRMNPSLERKKKQLSLSRKAKAAATNQIFWSRLIKWILMLWKDKSTVLIYTRRSADSQSRSWSFSDEHWWFFLPSPIPHYSHVASKKNRGLCNDAFLLLDRKFKNFPVGLTKSSM